MWAGWDLNQINSSPIESRPYGTAQLGRCEHVPLIALQAYSSLKGTTASSISAIGIDTDDSGADRELTQMNLARRSVS